MSLKALSVAPRAHKLGKSILVTPLGVEIVEGLAFEKWLELGELIQRAGNASQWALADWLAFGGHEYGALSHEACRITGLAPQTHHQLAWVADAVDPLVRREDLSFSHHVEVAPLERDAQQTWLARAATESLSCKALRDAIRGQRQVGSGNGGPPRARIHFDAPPERAERWQAAAEQAGKDFGEWAAEALDAAVE